MRDNAKAGSGPQIEMTLTSPRPTRRRGADTSRAAASKGAERTRELRRRLLAHLRSLPSTHPWATADELHLAVGAPMGVDLYETRRRVSDLAKARLIVDSGHRGETATGSPAIGWGASMYNGDYDGSSLRRRR